MHGFARFAITLLTANACLLAPVTGAFAFVPKGRAAWPVLTFLLLSCIADAVGAKAWLAILHYSERSRPLSPLAQ